MIANMAGLPWTFCPMQVMGDPGAGMLRFNSDVFQDVTAIAISDALADKRNPDVSAYVATWDRSTTLHRRGTLIIAKRAPGPEAICIFTINGSSTDHEGWTELAVAHVSSFGGFANREPLTVQLIPTGDSTTAPSSDRVPALEEAIIEVARELANTKQQLAVVQGALQALANEAKQEA